MWWFNVLFGAVTLQSGVQSQVESYQRLKNGTWCFLVNTQRYKVRIKGKVVQSKEWRSASLHHGVVAIEKGTFGSPSTKVANSLIRLEVNVIRDWSSNSLTSKLLSHYAIPRQLVFQEFLIRFQITKYNNP